MEIKEALEFLDAKANEITSLARLPYTNQDVILWRNSIEDVLEEVFSRDSTEYKRFYETRMKWPGKLTKERKQLLYDRQMRKRRTEIRSIINKYEILGIKEKPAVQIKPKDTPKTPLQLFDAMKFHPKVVEASRELFKDSHYGDAIYRAFVALNNLVKEKSGLQPHELRGMKDSQIMAKVFDANNPIIKVNEFISDTDISEQEGFKFLFMGATMGIRNPKAHDNIIQTNPFVTLEYLSLASLLMKKVEEGKLIKTSSPRKRWNLHRFLNDTKNRCSQEEMNLAKELYDFTKENADSIYWGTGAETGSFTFHKIRPNGIISIMSVYSDGLIYLNFGYMKDKGVRKDILESFRDKLNRIPSIKIPQNVVTLNKFPSIRAEILTEEPNIKVFKQTILELYQQLDEEEQT